MLDVQVQILSVDTGDFYSNREATLHWLNHKLRIERNELKKKEKDIVSKLLEYGINENDLKSILDYEYDFDSLEENIAASNLGEEYCKTVDLIKLKNNKIKKSKDRLLKLLSNKVEINEATNGKHHIRELRNLNPSGDKCNIYKYAKEPFNDKKIVSVFDSAFTRMIGAKQDELSEDFMVVQVYYFDIIKDLIYHGFTYKGEKYIYFTSSAGQIRTMENKQPPIKVVVAGRTFRVDSDATHSPVFHQFEGLVVDKNVSLVDLKSMLDMLLKQLLGEKTKTRFRPSYFPFTEPSVEVDVTCPMCGGLGCARCKQTGWMELLGAGIVNPKVLRNCGIDSDVYSGFAFGIGIDRIAMVINSIPDIRMMYENDVRFLSQNK